jgi:hypothetical protein
MSFGTELPLLLEMMRLPVERAIARTVYEEVRFVHANSADSICGKWPNIQLSWLQL